MKYLKLFENFSSLENIKLLDVIHSIKDYIIKTYKDEHDYDSPYGCESKYMLEDDISMDNLWEVYEIDTTKPNYWLSENFIKMLSDEKCHISLPYRFNTIKDRLNSLDNPMTIFRCISVDNNFLNDLLKGEISNLGKYWSFQKNDIKVQNSDKINNLLVFQCEIDWKFINFKDTILYNLNYYVGYQEAEIRLYENSTFKLQKIFYSNKTSNDSTFPFYDDKLYTEINIPKNILDLNYKI
jgi:hypothetical protein